jgi:hypothetical protein
MAEENKKEPVLYTAGPLTYTRGKLLLTMALIILGVFVYSVSVMFVPKIIPLRLKELGCSNTLLIFIMSTFAQVLNMTVCPWVSFKSDRFRSKRWGRRFIHSVKIDDHTVAFLQRKHFIGFSLGQINQRVAFSRQYTFLHIGVPTPSGQKVHKGMPRPGSETHFLPGDEADLVTPGHGENLYVLKR